MKVLIVYGHMEPKSFNAALLDTAVKTLTSKGHDVTVSDLYAMKFNPVMSRQDTTEDTSDQEHIYFPLVMSKAVDNQTLAEDIKEEQRKVKEADLIIFQFPLQWFTMPAIVKGWMDRVLLGNFAHNIEKLYIYDKGLLVGKKVLLSITTGGPADSFTPDGMHGDIRCHLAPLHNALRMCGFDIVRHNACFSPGTVSAEERQEMLDRWRQRLENIFKEPILTFPKFSDHDGLKLPADYKLSSQSSTEYGASPVQHMGRKIPPE